MDEKSETTPNAKMMMDVLFKEYDTLRSETNIRTSGLYQCVAISLGALTWVGSTAATASAANAQRPTSLSHWVWGTVVIIGLTFCTFFYMTVRDQKMASKRLKELEDQINSLAGDKELLCWENRWGASATGFFWRKKDPIERTWPQTSVPNIVITSEPM